MLIELNVSEDDADKIVIAADVLGIETIENDYEYLYAYTILVAALNNIKSGVPVDKVSELSNAANIVYERKLN